MDHLETPFESAWPALERKLRAGLAARRVPPDALEDVLQETALRLLRSWGRVRGETLWAFTLTVALNIVRDDARKRQRRENVPVEDLPPDRDPEHEALVRMELDRVRAALASMNEKQRAILLSEVGEAAMPEGSAGGIKMARMRARQRLRALIEDASAFVGVMGVRARRWADQIDTSIANAAASLTVRLSAAAVASAVAVPALLGGGPLATTEWPAAESDTASVPHSRRSPVALAERGRREGEWGRAVTGSIRLSERDRREGPGLNEHFGPIHRDGTNVTVEDEEQIGPYGVDHRVAEVVGGNQLAARFQARYDAAKCWKKFFETPQAGCREPGQGRSHVLVQANGQRRGLGVGTE